MTSSGDIPRLTREIIERTTTTIVSQRQTLAQGSGASGLSAGTGPGANRAWLIQGISAIAQFGANPGASDRGVGTFVFDRATVIYEILSAQVEDDNDQGLVAVGMSGPMILKNPDTFRVLADARGSSVTVNGSAVVWGFEFDVV